MPGRDVPVILADAAVEDVQSIYRQIAEERSFAAADDIYNELLAAFARLGSYPESGAKRDHVRPHYRIVPVSSWVIWYRWRRAERRVIVMRVLHGHMDANRHLPR